MVSIVLPTYNRAHVLGDAIQSVLQQSYSNLELIVVDDNSPDNTRDVVNSFDDKRLKYVKNETNLKLPGTLNKGFSIAKGDFLTWTSDDNLLAEQAIAEMVAVLLKGSCDFVFADYYEFSELDTESKRPKDAKHVRLPDELALEKGNQVGACFMYTRKAYETIGDYNTDLFLVEDYDYWIRIGQKFQIAHIPKPLYFFRRDDQTLYCSRFCEVKVSDFLVRYKNKLLGNNEVVAAVADLILKNSERLNNAFLKSAYHLIKKTSFRLTGVYLKWLTFYINFKVKSKINAILEAYDKKDMSFKEAKEALTDIMNRIATIEYR